MRKVVVARLSAGLLLTLGANAQANGLGSDSTGKDWVTAPADERSGWAKRTANIFNKDVPLRTSPSQTPYTAVWHVPWAPQTMPRKP